MSSGETLDVARTVPLDGLRGVVARRMLMSSASTARVTLHGDADASSLAAARKRLKTAGETASYEDLVIWCVSRVLPRHPTLNGRLVSSAIVPSRSANIGIAIALEDGLVVPTLRDAQAKSVTEIAAERASLVARARQGKLGVQDMTGGTFTISNIGAYRVRHFTPLINVPQIAILGLGRITPGPWVEKDGRLAVRPVLGLSLSFDHAAVNGDPAAALLSDLVNELENFECGQLDVSTRQDTQ